MRFLHLAVLALVPLAPSCVAAAGLGAGAAVTYELLTDTAHIAHVRVDVDDVWPATREALDEMGASSVDVQNYPRLITAEVYDGDLVLEVQAYDIDHSVVRLQFRKNGLIDNVTAQKVLEEILAHLGRSTPSA